MYNVKDPAKDGTCTSKRSSMRYRKVTWTYLDGNNLQAADAVAEGRQKDA